MVQRGGFDLALGNMDEMGGRRPFFCVLTDPVKIQLSLYSLK